MSFSDVALPLVEEAGLVGLESPSGGAPSEQSQQGSAILSGVLCNPIFQLELNPTTLAIPTHQCYLSQTRT